VTNIIESEPDSIVLPDITVFSKNDCYQCTQVKNRLGDNGIPFTEINVEEDLEPRPEFNGLTPFEHVVQNYGKAMPLIVVEDGAWGEHWTGIRPDKLIPLISKAKLALDQLRAEGSYDEDDET
jgi:hypothetical protein